ISTSETLFPVSENLFPDMPYLHAYVRRRWMRHGRTWNMHHSLCREALAMVLKFETATGLDAVLSMASRRQRPVAMNDNRRSFAGLREKVTGAELRRLPDLFAILDRRNRPGR